MQVIIQYFAALNQSLMTMGQVWNGTIELTVRASHQTKFGIWVSAKYLCWLLLFSSSQVADNVDMEILMQKPSYLLQRQKSE